MKKQNLHLRGSKRVKAQSQKRKSKRRVNERPSKIAVREPRLQRLVVVQTEAIMPTFENPGAFTRLMDLAGQGLVTIVKADTILYEQDVGNNDCVLFARNNHVLEEVRRAWSKRGKSRSVPVALGPDALDQLIDSGSLGTFD